MVLKINDLKLACRLPEGVPAVNRCMVLMLFIMSNNVIEERIML